MGWAWGKSSLGRGNPGTVLLFISCVTIKLEASVGNWSEDWHASPYVVEWGSLLSMDPPICAGLSQKQVLSLVKEALVVYGRDGRHNRNTPERIVRFGF